MAGPKSTGDGDGAKRDSSNMVANTDSKGTRRSCGQPPALEEKGEWSF